MKEPPMCDTFNDQKNVFLDQILAERRSYRMFKPEFPPDDNIRRIIHAGLLAPYAAAAVGGSKEYFRRFFVMRNGSQSMQNAIPLVMEQVVLFAEGLEKAMNDDPGLKAKAVMFARRLSAIRKMGIVPGIGTAPYYIVVAERRGFPPVELQSLAHCMENMWLKATALCLGFQIVSVTSQMSSNPEFCRILGIPAGEWELMGCAIGYPQEELPPSVRPPVDDVTRWLD
jgi:nitroreductase